VKDNKVKYMRMLLVLVVILTSGTLSAGVVELSLTVDPAHELGRIKAMNAVNNGPSIPSAAGTQIRGNFDAYAQARFPYARLHDSINCVPGGAHMVDISAVCHLTDETRLYTEVPLTLADDGAATLLLQPLAYGYVEVPDLK